MWCPKWGNLSIRPNIEIVVDASGNGGSGQLRTPSLSIISWVTATVEVVVLKFEKDGRVRGDKHGKHCES